MWAPYGENTADDRDRLLVWLGAGWKSWPDIKGAFKATDKTARLRLKTDLNALIKAGEIERRVTGTGNVSQRRTHYRTTNAQH
ncbi:hypothetical protein LCGC14_1369980 [marine sediment metagenome]|uniref:Uncharacterized protein n=1 Tax=marine sediment metagenome TaxID=412755 RepID=A0A0F9K5S8_9ZZZZ